MSLCHCRCHCQIQERSGTCTATACQIVPGGLGTRSLAFCLFLALIPLFSFWLELVTGSGTERVLKMCSSSFLNSLSSTHTFILSARAPWNPRVPKLLWWSLSFSSRISRRASIEFLMSGAILDSRVTMHSCSSPSVFLSYGDWDASLALFLFSSLPVLAFLCS